MPASRSRHRHGPSEVLQSSRVQSALRQQVKTLGGRLRSLRKAREWTLETAAEHVHVHAVHLARMESGKDVNPTLAVLVSCALAYGVPLTALFSEAAGDGDARAPVRRQHRGS